MVLFDLAGVAFVGIAVGVASYLLGRFTGTRVERKRWKRRIANEVRELARSRAIIHRALEKPSHQ
jgi:hypothetical protein